MILLYFKLTDTQVSKISKAFANGSSANIKFSKTKSISHTVRRIFDRYTWYYIFIDNFINFPFKMAISYLKELNNNDSKK